MNVKEAGGPLGVETLNEHTSNFRLQPFKV